MSKLSQHLAAGFDPVKLAGRLGLEADPWQAAVLRSRHRRQLLICHRQAGKSTVGAVLAVHNAVYSPGSLTLLAAPALRQSQELFRPALNLYRSLGRPVPSEAENALSLTLENGSRIVSLPGDERTTRGFSGVSLLIIDEASRVDDDVLAAVLPSLAISRGRLLAMSTPYGKRGWFYEASRSPEWDVTRISAEDCPRLTAEDLETYRNTLGEWRFRQEFLCQFEDLRGQMFAHEDIEAVFAPGRLGAVPPGALFAGPQRPEPLALGPAPEAPRPRRYCPGHMYRADTCLVCGQDRPILLTTGGEK